MVTVHGSSTTSFKLIGQSLFTILAYRIHCHSVQQCNNCNHRSVVDDSSIHRAYSIYINLLVGSKKVCKEAVY